MSDIDVYLAKIKSAIYGEEVRGAIHDSIQAMNTELGNTNTVVANLSKDCTASEYENLPVSEKQSGKTFYLYDSGRIMRNGVSYGVSGDDEVIGSASGRMVRFSAASALAKTLKTELYPVQCGAFGDPYGPGKKYNLLDSSILSPEGEVGGLTIVADYDFGVITIGAGTATEDISINIGGENVGVLGDDYCDYWLSGGINSNIKLRGTLGGGRWKYDDTGSGVNIPTNDPDYTRIRVYLMIAEGTVITEPVEIFPMVYKKTMSGHRPITDLPKRWYPYKNIVTIQKNDVIEINDCSANLFDYHNISSYDNVILDENGNNQAETDYGYVKGVPIVPNTVFSISGNLLDNDHGMYVYFFDHNGYFLSRSRFYRKSNLDNGYLTISTPAKAYRLGFTFVENFTTLNTIQVELGGNATTYSNYSNNKISITLNNQVWGGPYDMTAGKISEGWAEIQSYNNENLPGEWVSDRDVYVPGTKPTIGAQVVYKMRSTGLAMDENNINLTTKSGVNTLWILRHNRGWDGVKTLTDIEYTTSMFESIPHIFEIESANYEAMSEADQMNGTIYFLVDKGIQMLNGVAYGAGGGGSRFGIYQIANRNLSTSSVTVSPSEITIQGGSTE